MNWNKTNIVKGSLVVVGGISVFSFLFGSKIKKYLSGSASDITVEALSAPKVKQQADDIVKHTLQNPENKKLLANTIIETLSDDSIIKVAIKSVNKMAKNPKLQNNLNSLLLNACMETINKEEFNQRINQKLMILIQDAEIQKHTGDHLYNAAKYALVPKSVISLIYILFLIIFFGILYLFFNKQ